MSARNVDSRYFSLPRWFCLGIEEEIRALREAGDLAGAATLAVRGFGPEVMGLLLAIHRDEDAAREVFASFLSDLWAGLPSFRGDASLRTWAYVLARRASERHRRMSARRAKREVLPGEPGILEEAVALVRTVTATFRRTESRERLARLRALLAPDEHMLLVLRIDRGMGWSDVARVLAEPGECDDEESVSRASARLRQRFRSVKEKLRRAAAKEQA